jgi:hypothetical protein
VRAVTCSNEIGVSFMLSVLVLVEMRGLNEAFNVEWVESMDVAYLMMPETPELIELFIPAHFINLTGRVGDLVVSASIRILFPSSRSFYVKLKREAITDILGLASRE